MHIISICVYTHIHSYTIELSRTHVSLNQNHIYKLKFMIHRHLRSIASGSASARAPPTRSPTAADHTQAAAHTSDSHKNRGGSAGGAEGGRRGLWGG